MPKVLILGAGVMGSALASVAAGSIPTRLTATNSPVTNSRATTETKSKNSVILVGSPLDDDIIVSLQKNHHHPGLQVTLPDSIEAVRHTELQSRHINDIDVVVLGVSSPGIGWALDELSKHQLRPNLLALVTKGLVAADKPGLPPRTYAEVLEPGLTVTPDNIVGIGGPCIARELAMGYPTCVSFGSKDIAAANQLQQMLECDYYRVSTTTDFTGLEACAALKNFMAIGASAMMTVYTLGDSYAKNPLAAVFNQAVFEIEILSDWIRQAVSEPLTKESVAKSQRDVAYDLPGMGDLHVTVGGGRNSRLGRFLGEGRNLNDVMENEMRGVTVEGVDTGRQLLDGFRSACEQGVLNKSELPLSSAILNVIEHNTPFDYRFT